MAVLCPKSADKDFISYIAKSAEENLLIVYSLDVEYEQNIVLHQEPNESLKLNVRIPKATDKDYHCNTCNASVNVHEIDTVLFCLGHVVCKKYLYNLSLEFDNYLHDASNDYSYKITLQALVNDMSSGFYHIDLFSTVARRTEKIISLVDQMFLVTGRMNMKLVHVCCSISRFRRIVNNQAQQNTINLNDNNVALLMNSFHNDISLVVDDKIFPAHKNVLSSKSEVFKAMFTHEMTENQDGIVQIDEFDSQVIEEMLNYMYTNETKNLSEMSQELFQVAHKYEIHNLKYKCEEFFLFNLNPQTVISILDLARIYDLEDLRKSAFKFISKYEEDMVKEDSFKNFLCRDLRVDNVAKTLKLCIKYDLDDVKLETFKFIRKHQDVISNDEFLSLFVSNSLLMQELFVYIFKELQFNS